MDFLEEEESVKRSYGCTFCKQGFTNAQALGGHMNIHRKDRTKGKGHQHLSGTSSDDKKLKDHVIHINPGPVFPRQKRSFIERNFWARSPTSPGGTDHGNLDDSLSLCIGSSLSSNHKEQKIDVDLELRLGRDPPFDAR
ncbi:hypothetical protein MLD38_010227 [Melastoma candidum]|uniref:Uncharacterized protein n=1 Tax=Melastoma candidum TaxID=119954 RepID=A0ACB9R086_9MYRT|nr:hypothetical protein MLD38_010227 [Melastoma candidum]